MKISKIFRLLSYLKSEMNAFNWHKRSKIYGKLQYQKKKEKKEYKNIIKK